MTLSASETAADLTNAAQRLGYRSFRRYHEKASFLFDQVPLADRSVLDVGCGKGDFALWAGLQGATRVLGIEPESDGSSSGSLKVFESLIEEFGLTQTVTASRLALEEVLSQNTFDIIVMYNVINHLDETAVGALPDDRSAVESYLTVGRQLRSLLNPGGILILADCGRLNFWGNFGLLFPLASGQIDWRKHQEPEVWVNLFRDAGFKLWDHRWSPLYPLGRLSGNRLIQYFTVSHFVLRFTVAKND